MGTYLSQFPQKEERKTNFPLIGLSLPKIRELHGGYKSLCNAFSINLTEFENIFQCSVETFNIFDTDQNGLIDALELFAGIVVFSESSGEDKVRFLFDFFDFNESFSLNLMDLEFLLSSVLIATSKIFGLDLEPSDTEIVALVKKNFMEGYTINQNQLLIWSCKCEDVQNFFRKVDVEPPHLISHKQLQPAEFEVIKSLENYNVPMQPPAPPQDRPQFIPRAPYLLATNKVAQNFRTWLYAALQPITEYRNSIKEEKRNYAKVADELKMRFEWIYGIRCQDTYKPILYNVGRRFADTFGARDRFERQMADASEEVIYFVSNTCIILNIHLNRQRFYTQHVNEIISIAVSNKNGDIVASGELASSLPAVHIWNCRTLDNINILQGVHQKGVHLLAFSNDDKFLVTCGIGAPSSILVYNWATGQVLISSCVAAPTRDILILKGKESITLKYDAGEGDEQTAQDEAKAIEALIMNQQSAIIKGFVILSLDTLILFNYDENHAEFKELYLQLGMAAKKTKAKPLCSLTFLVDYKNAFYEKGNEAKDGRGLGKQLPGSDIDQKVIDADHELKHILLTGHEDGRILVWRLQNFVGVLKKYEKAVTAMSKCYEGIAFGTADGFIHIWDEALKKVYYTIDIGKFGFQVMSRRILSFDYCQLRLLVLTLHGDAVQIHLSEVLNMKGLRAQKISAIVRLPGTENLAMTILDSEEQTIMLGGDAGVVTSFDLSTHEMIDAWNIGEVITALTCLALDNGGFLVVVGTEQGRIVIRQDWEQEVERVHQCGELPITDVKISKSGQFIAIASKDKNIYLMSYQDGEYISHAACLISTGFPISLNFSEDSRLILINTSQRKLLVFDPFELKLLYSPNDIRANFWCSWQCKYQIDIRKEDFLYKPIIIGNTSSIACAGDDNGNVFLWLEVEHIKENISMNFACHTSPVQKIRLTLDDSRLITMGKSDRCLCQFKLRPLFSQKRDEAFKKNDKIEMHFDQDETLILELNYCFQIIVRKTDQIVDQTAIVRGTTNPIVSRALARLNFEQEPENWKRPPSLSLVLEHIYGALVADRRHTIMYMHFYSKIDQDQADQLKEKTLHLKSQVLSLGQAAEKKLDWILPRVMGTDYQSLLRQEMPIEYDQIHATCSKNIVYYSSRFGIVFDMNKKKQQFYQGHKLKISSIARHPYLRLIATGEVNLQPIILVWDSATLETYTMLETSHKGGVLHLSFSPDGQKLVSIGMDRTFSMQVFIWRQKRTIAFRNCGYNPIFGLKFNPYDSTVFITCGYQHMAEWKIQGCHLTCVKYINVLNRPIDIPLGNPIFEIMDQDAAPKRNILIAMDFISIRMGKNIQSDVVFGTNIGDISTYCGGRYFLLKEQAHPGVPINVIKVTNVLSIDMRTVRILTGGEDGIIKIWDQSIQLLQQIDVRKQVSIQDLKNIKSYGVQSLDVFPCDRQNVQSTATVRLLCGMRCGDVLEIEIDFNRNYITPEEVIQNKTLTEAQKLKELSKLKVFNSFHKPYKISFREVLSGHSSLQLSYKLKKILTCLHPIHPILASVGNDETLVLWNIERQQCLTQKNLHIQATSLDFSPDGLYLAVGLITGVFMLLEAKIEKQTLMGFQHPYTIPTLGMLMGPKQSRNTVVALKFSTNDPTDYLAVSYNNEFRQEDEEEEPDFAQSDNPVSQMTSAASWKKSRMTREGNKELFRKDPCFVLIFVRKESPKNPGIQLLSKDPFVKLQKVTLPTLELTVKGLNLNDIMSVTKLDFSGCDRFLEMSSQIIDKDNNITHDSGEDAFMVWDIKEGKFIQDHFQTQWPQWSLSSAVNARYINEKIMRETDEIEKKKFALEQMFVTKICRFKPIEDPHGNLLDFAVMGTNFGEIFAFRFPSLFLDKNRLLEFKFDRVLKRDMAISKGFDALTSIVQSLSVFNNEKVFVTGDNDQCILQYKINFEDMEWEMDFNQLLPEISDPFGEIPSYPDFMALISEIWHQRQAIPEIYAKMDMQEHEDPLCSFKLENIIGRRGYDRRNNLKIDCLNRILYSASSLMVFLKDNDDPDGESQIHQSFLKPQGDNFQSTSPEVSCFSLSDSGRLLFIGTNSVKGNLIVWEIPSKVMLKKIELPTMSIIYALKVAYDSKHCVMIGVTPEYLLSILLVDTSTENILCQKLFMHSSPFKIKDVEFLPGYTRRFVTCGIQHMCFWSFNGQNLEYQVGEMTILKVSQQSKQKVYNPVKENVGKFGLSLVVQEKYSFDEVGGGFEDEIVNVRVTFLCVIFLNDTLIAAGDDGFLYIWEDNKITSRTFAHQGAILSVDVNARLEFLASGGMDGLVLLWRLMVDPISKHKTLDQLKEFNLRRSIQPQQAVMNPDFNVQSVFVGKNRVIIGLRSGTIIESRISDDGTAMVRAKQDAKSNTRKWMKCTDHQVPTSVAVDMVSRRIFTMTQSGVFSVWDLLTFDVIYSRDFFRVAQNIFSFKLSNKIMLVFSNEIIVLDVSEGSPYVEMDGFNLKLNQISDAKLNTSEKLLGVASTKESTPQVILYATSKEGLEQIQVYERFKASIKFIDFSTDNYYIQCEDNLGEVQLFEIETQKLVNIENTTFDLEWLGEGLRTYKPLENIRKQYTADNKMQQIVKLPGKPIIAIGDEIGTIRLFNYPNRGSQEFYQVYPDHLYNITKCMFTYDKRFFVSISSFDRCVFKWKTTYNEERIEELIKENLKAAAKKGL